MAWESIVISAVLPAALDLVRGIGGAISRKWFGLSVDDQIKLENAQVEKMKALATLDNPYGTPTQWIIDLRASFRYITASVLILAGVGLMAVGGFNFLFNHDTIDQEVSKVIIMIGMEVSGTPFAFVFGERMWTGLRGLFK